MYLFQVPSSAPIAVNVRVRADAEAREREEVKRLTLMANRCGTGMQAEQRSCQQGREGWGGKAADSDGQQVREACTLRGLIGL